MGYNSISCPKCGVDLSIEESMRGTRITCPSCNYQMHVPTYTEENIPVIDPSAIRPFVAPAPETETKKESSGVSQLLTNHAFTIGVILLMLVLIASFAVNAMLLVSLTSVKAFVRAQEEREKKAELRAEEEKKKQEAVKWEYKIVCVNGEPSAAGAENTKGALQFPQQTIKDTVDKLGNDKWTLCNVFPLSETVFTNVSEDELIP